MKSTDDIFLMVNRGYLPKIRLQRRILIFATFPAPAPKRYHLFITGIVSKEKHRSCKGKKALFYDAPCVSKFCTSTCTIFSLGISFAYHDLDINSLSISLAVAM